MKVLSRMLTMLALAVATVGCTSATGTNEKPRVAVSLYPLQYLAESIVGEHMEVLNIVPPGSEPHETELSVRDVFHLDTANIAFRFDGLQPAVDAVAREVSGIIDVGAAVDKVRLNGVVDPHFWLDPQQMASTAELMTDAISQVDPNNAAVYEHNLQALQDELMDLDGSFHDSLTTCTHSSFVTGHAAFGYLARAYDLTQLSVAGLDPDTEPSTAAMASTRDELSSLGLPAVFAEPGETKIAAVLAAELNISQLVLDPLETITKEDTYISVMERNREALVEGLQCR